MGDIRELIQTLLADDKLQNAAGQVYRDEPILKTAAQLHNYMPPQYRAMRKIAGSSSVYYLSDAKLFVKQGEFMADFEDDFEYHGEFNRYFPTYQTMNDLQLRGYFSWRTKLRRGEVTKTSLSFAFVYIYELLNGIGVKDAEEGFEALRSFHMAYRQLDAGIERYMKIWLHDYCVYYNLPTAVQDEETSFDAALQVLLSCNECDDDTLFGALCTLSSYNPESSRFYKAYAEALRAVSCRVFRALSAHFERDCKTGLCEKYFGRRFAVPYQMFRAAVFDDRRQYADYTYSCSDIHSYTCKNGSWRCDKYYGCREKSRDLGAVLKATDARLREKFEFPSLLKPPKATKLLLRIIDREIEEYRAEKKRGERMKIELDISKLQGIRRASLATQEKLLVEEALPYDGSGDLAAPVLAPVCEAPVFSGGDTGLAETEARLLRHLLEGSAYDTLLRESGAMLSVLVDRINEALFDRFDDTVIDWDGSRPFVLDDYREELKGSLLS